MFVLSVVYKFNVENFICVESIKGKNCMYFVISKVVLLENGSSINFKVIFDSLFWVVINNNIVKKMNMLE